MFSLDIKYIASIMNIKKQRLFINENQMTKYVVIKMDKWKISMLNFRELA